MKKTNWTFKKCRKVAKKCKTRSEFAQKYRSAYQAAIKLGILDKICSHMKRMVRKDWTHEELFIVTKKYKTRGEFLKNDNGAYQAAKLRGILEEVCSHMPKHVDQSGENGSNFKWSNEKLREEALKYNNRYDFQVGSPSAYRTAAQKGILDEICSHMKRSAGTSRPEIELTNILREQLPNLIKKFFAVNIPGKPHIHRFQVDILDLQNRLGIEYDGPYHHSEKGLIQYHKKWPIEDAINYHEIKDAALLNCHGIKLLHIKEVDWKADKQACIDKCLEFLGIEQKKIAA